MRTIDLNKPLIDLDGNDSALTQGKLAAQAIAASQSGDALKLWGWAKLLHAGKPLELELPEIELLVKTVNESPLLTVISRAQIITNLKG